MEGSTAAFAPVRGDQLSFEVGGEADEPRTASIGISGSGDFKRELYMDDDVTVRISDADGQVVAAFEGKVAHIGFKRHEEREGRPAFVERVHKIKLGEPA